MTSPVEQFIQWYEGLPISHRVDIAAFFGHAVPGFGSIDLTAIDGMPDAFVTIVRSHTDSRFAEVGLTLTLRVCTEFFFIDKRSSRVGWRQTEEALRSIARENESEKFEQLANEVPFRAAQWVRTCEQWDSILPALSDAALETWIRP